MLELIQKGGFVMWPILVCALGSIAIIIERSLFFFVTGIRYEHFRDLLVQKLTKKGFSDESLLGSPSAKDPGLLARVRREQWNRSPYYKIVRTYLENIDNNFRTREEALKRTGSEEIEKMERHLQGLSAISNVSPLLGLLGTVTGVIASFSVISRLGGQVDVTALAGGIWEAMLTTAAGLVVAIPSQLAYLYFEKIVSARASRMSYLITYMNEKLFEDIGNHLEYGHAQYRTADEIIPQVKVEDDDIASDEVR